MSGDDAGADADDSVADAVAGADTVAIITLDINAGTADDDSSGGDGGASGSSGGVEVDGDGNSSVSVFVSNDEGTDRTKLVLSVSIRAA